MRKARGKRGFTLVELLVVIAIIGVLVALLLPAIQAAREAARRMSCSNNLKQIGLALHNYHDTYNTFPPDAIWYGNRRGTQAAAGDQRHYTWIAMIMPFFEQQTLHDKIDFRIPGYGQIIPGIGPADDPNLPVQSIQVPNFLCPSDTEFAQLPHGFAYTSYAGSAGWDGHRRFYADTRRAGVFPFMDSTKLRDNRDGTSNTIMVGEVTNGGYCCRSSVPNTTVTRWTGGTGKLRQSNSRVFRSLLIAPQAWVTSHSWITAAGKGDVIKADGQTGGLWGQWGAPYALGPVYYDHYAMNVEWPGAGSVHPGGAQFCLADASTRFISEQIACGSGTTLGDSYGRNGNVWVAAHTIQGNTQGVAEAEVVWP